MGWGQVYSDKIFGPTGKFGFPTTIMYQTLWDESETFTRRVKNPPARDKMER